VYSCVIPGSIGIFSFNLFEETAFCGIDSQVPSSVFELFNLLHVASITNSSFVIVLVSSFHTIL